MRIYVLVGHPDRDSFNTALADAYCAAAVANGHEIRRHDLAELSFDPILHRGYKLIQPLEPDLVAAQENLTWCEHWVIFYPVWWGNAPALLKGYFDRALTPGFAFRYHDNDPFWDKLLAGRSAHVITTSDAPDLFLRFAYRNGDINAVKRATLEFCGFAPVKVTRIGPMRYFDDNKRRHWLARIAALA